MSPKYDIFKEYSDGSFVWIEAVEDIIAARQRLEILVARAPGRYQLWDSAFHTFVSPLAKSA
jgi:hypothetical protein